MHLRISTMSQFAALGLSESIVQAIQELGFNQPTEIQQKAIPNLINNPIDLIGLAQTGTGKTAAFGLPLLTNIDPKKKYIQALILSPTRELGLSLIHI